MKKIIIGIILALCSLGIYASDDFVDKIMVDAHKDYYVNREHIFRMFIKNMDKMIVYNSDTSSGYYLVPINDIDEEYYVRLSNDKELIKVIEKIYNLKVERIARYTTTYNMPFKPFYRCNYIKVYLKNP